MATVQAIRTAIADALAGISDVRWYDKYYGQTVGPAGVVRRQQIMYGTDFDGNENATYAISLYIPITDVVVAQTLMDELLSPSGTNSVVAALEADQTLGGVVHWCVPIRASDDGITNLSSIDHLTATITCAVGTE